MTTLNISVIPRAKANQVVERDGHLVVRVTAVPTDGKANAMVKKLLSNYFHLPASHIRIIRGSTSRKKVIQYGT